MEYHNDLCLDLCSSLSICFPWDKSFADKASTSTAMQMTPSCIYQSSLMKMEACLLDINEWMTQNFLLLNSDKTEIMVVGPKSLRHNLSAYMLNIDGISITSIAVIKDLGVTLDSDLSFDAHIKNISRVAFYHLRNISKIRKMLSLHNAEILVHAFVTSRLDYCNALLSGCANSTLKGLQLIQNAAARILTRTSTSAQC